MVLDVAQLQALLSNTFNLGLDVGRGKEEVALVRLRLAKALIGAAEANAVAAESIAIQRGVSTEEIAQTEALALHAAAFNGMPDPVFHLAARAMGIITGLAAIEPDPRAPTTICSWTRRFRPRPPCSSCCSSAGTASPRPAALSSKWPPHASSTPQPN